MKVGVWKHRVLSYDGSKLMLAALPVQGVHIESLYIAVVTS